MLLRHPSIRLLFVAQALYWSCSMIGVTLTALVGMQLAPLNGLATLPLALLVLGNLLAAQPLSLFMQRRGRRAGLRRGALAGIGGGLVCAQGVAAASFPLFGLGCLLIGGYQASAMYYRFAALESVAETQRGRAAAWVVGGGVCAALVGPDLALWAKDALPLPFVGAYLTIAVLAAAAWALLGRLPDGGAPAPAGGGWRILAALLARPAVRGAMATTAIGHGLMILVMNATPLAMNACGLPLHTSADVMRGHMLGMFLPAFVAGPLVDRLGGRRVALLGSVVLLASAAIALGGSTATHFLLSSVCLGLGWNLMLVAGTTLLARAHRPEERGHAQGLMELGNGLVAACASFAAGALIGGAGWNAINLLIPPLVLLAWLMLAAARRETPAAA